MITPQNVLKHELIGLTAEISSPQGRRGYAPAQGIIADETRETITLKCADGTTRSFPKKETVLRLTLPEGATVEVEGRLLAGRPEDRIKKKIRITN
ncbi:Ribonuclease P protein component 1 [uncultured archaeon]|nr:Ribonuclease P protein component 1 [uncultured archaeon]